MVVGEVDRGFFGVHPWFSLSIPGEQFFFGNKLVVVK